MLTLNSVEEKVSFGDKFRNKSKIIVKQKKLKVKK